MIYDRNDITVIDNFNPQNFSKKFLSLVKGVDFTWSWGTILPKEKNDRGFKVDMPEYLNRHMCRLLYVRENPKYGSDYTEYGGISPLSINTTALKLLFPLFKELGIKKGQLEKVKINLTPWKPENSFSGWHWDPTEENVGKGMTAIYYFNTCNGKTLFKDPYREIDSIKNRIVIFPNERLHGGTFQTDTPERCVLNINWLLDKN